ncbi:MAG: hypothetical protein JNL74_23245, partial [Fibrobacteres bacterium]|nr:hypothetical protein [Fibrobacterota bacterium]
EMLTGTPPFLGDNPLAVAYKHVNVPPPPIAEKTSGVPRRLELVVLKSLKKDRTVRYQNADEFLQDLDRVFEDTSDPVTRGMERISVLKGDTASDNPVADDKRVTDRRELDRRREPRRSSYRRYTEGELRQMRGRRRKIFLLASCTVIIAAFIIYFSFLKNQFSRPETVLPLYSRISGEGNPEKALDDNVRTAWVGTGSTPSFSCSFWKADAVNRIDILSGIHEKEKSYGKYARPQKIRLLFNDKDELTIDLDDTPERQVIRLPEIKAVRSVKITVLEVYPGTESPSPAITETRFWFAPVP